MFPINAQDTPLDILAKALHSSDVKEQLRATTRFRKCLSIGKSGGWVLVDESICYSLRKSVVLVLSCWGGGGGICDAMC